MKKFKQYKEALSDSEIISPPVMASKANKGSRGPAGAVTHSEQADPPGRPPAPDTKAPMYKLKKDQLNAIGTKQIKEAFYTNKTSWEEDMKEHGATHFEKTKTRIIAMKADGDILGAWSIDDNHGVTGLGTNIQKVKKEEIEHNNCGTPDCCGQCDTAIVEDTHRPLENYSEIFDHSEEIDKLNEQLDEVLTNPFANPFLIIHAVRAILERFSVNLPMLDMDGIDDVFVFEITNTGYYLYIAIDQNDSGHFEGYAQVVDKQELKELEQMDPMDDSVHHDDIPEYPSHFILQARHSADD